ncbi:MAG: RdgB/HAM1 family non-canonical purine NTP pyrophosphatase [Vicinamibacterales bacterium]
MERLLVATTNAGKLREIEDILRGLPFQLLSLGDLPPVDEPVEDGSTFEENARLKAHGYSRTTGLPTVAEDSGLEIDVLDGAPGIHSARFPGATYPDKFRRLFEMMDARHASGSTARFVCALALVDGDRVLFETTATVEGSITREPRGGGGFGYDPILFYPPTQCTLAELSQEDKSAVSHRGKAFRALRAHLESRR